MASQDFDIVVIGGGNAGLSAAIVAAEAGARVCVLEAAPQTHRGGNSRHTRNLRAMHDAPTDVLTDAYDEEEYWADLLRVTKGKTDEQLARIAIRRSSESVDWLIERGVRFQPALGGTLHLGRTNAFFMGGGKALMNALYRHAAKLGIEVRYDAKVDDLNITNGSFNDLTYTDAAGARTSVSGRALIAAAGGFESNREWLKDAWGPAAENFLIRGTPYNMGGPLKMLLAAGAEQIGDPTQCHAVAIDGRAPLYDGGIVTRIDCVSLGVVVNVKGERFYDEGEDFWPKRYAIWGRLVAAQPDQKAHVIIDDKAIGRFMPPVFPPETADDIPTLAAKIDVDPTALTATIDGFNAAVQPGGDFDHTVLDDCRTAGLAIEKTHWARPIDTPPYRAYTLRPGVTFTYLGVKVDDRARMLMQGGAHAENIFAAGEIMAGNVLGEGYVAGVGMTIGGVFGRIAGEEAARYVAH